jgi:hypothetical protein
MKFTLAQEHIDHFIKNGTVEFDNLFSEKECSLLLSSAEDIMQKRLNPTPRNPIEEFSNENLYLHGKNLWKDGLEIKKLCTKKQVGQIAHLLFRKKPIKLAYDQYLKTGNLQDCPFKENNTLQEISSIRPLLGALIIALKPIEGAIEDTAIPKKMGNAVFISGAKILPLSTLFNEKNISLFIIALTAGKALYCLEPKDLHTHDFKKEGLVFGDAAGEDFCPTIYHM